MSAVPDMSGFIFRFAVFFCIKSQPVKLNIYYLDKCNHVTWVKLGLAIMYVFFNYIDN